MSVGGSETANPLNDFRLTWTERGFPGSIERAALAQTLERARRVVDTAIEDTLKPFGLSRSRFELLIRLMNSENGAQQLGKLGDLLFVHPTSVTSLVDRLEKAGLVKRIVAEGDRRAILAQITEAGRQAVTASAAALGGSEFGLGHISIDEAIVLRGLLARVIELGSAEALE
jgi:DNA-binding MarR family transcriptional regulator